MLNGQAHVEAHLPRPEPKDGTLYYLPMAKRVWRLKFTVSRAWDGRQVMPPCDLL